jgi:hypothetical protein
MLLNLITKIKMFIKIFDVIKTINKLYINEPALNIILFIYK